MDSIMQPSAVALLDVLGFKGIEAQAPPALVAEALTAVRETMSDMAKIMSSIPDEEESTRMVSVQKAWFSDTIYLIAQLPAGKKTDAGRAKFLIDCVATTLSAAIREAAIGEVPLVFRGVVTFGDALVEGGDIFFGRAIVEAAELYEKADGAFVWLTPKAAELVGELPSCTRYKVPLKGGQHIDTLAINPTYYAGAEGIEGIRKGFATAMSQERIDVVLKRQNTMTFSSRSDARSEGAHKCAQGFVDVRAQ